MKHISESDNSDQGEGSDEDLTDELVSNTTKKVEQTGLEELSSREGNPLP